MDTPTGQDVISNPVGDYGYPDPYPTDRQFARALDQQDPLSHFREQFHIPSKRSLAATRILSCAAAEDDGDPHDESAIYLAGNQMGLQPRQTCSLVQKHLATWAQQGVYGLAKQMEGDDDDDPHQLPTWGEADRAAARMTAPLVGALPEEVSIMGGLTANLHALMASFYVPDMDGKRTKIILERDTFSSDYFACQSQIQWHGLNPADHLVVIEPEDRKTQYLSTSRILSVIEEHASSTALVLLSGVQYLSGQVLDIPTITRYAHEKGIPAVGWDLAHAVGNIELQLRDWGVDFAVWCHYKYMNAGPGAIAGVYVHERHGAVVPPSPVAAVVVPSDQTGGSGRYTYRPRLVGWWGSEMKTRFAALEDHNEFIPSTGAAGFQLSNPSVLDTVALMASLNIFSQASMPAIRNKSGLMAAYLDSLIQQQIEVPRPFQPMCPSLKERGAQLSLRFHDQQLLVRVMARLKGKGIVVAQSRDVMRVAPVPLYNTFSEIWEFVQEFKEALSLCGTDH